LCVFQTSHRAVIKTYIVQVKSCRRLKGGKLQEGGRGACVRRASSARAYRDLG